jgi:peptidoglycan/xylan/chitin deacetylase (PgdA/CDA1 family)
MEQHTPHLLPSYHLVLPGYAKYVYSVTADDFDRHLEVISDASSADCSLTFDDCHVSQFRCAFPLLQRHGVRARFFAIAGWIGKRSDYMTWQHLRELVAAGHEVHSHSLSHVPLTRCSEEELTRELRHSRYELEQELGVAVDSISVPFGRWDREVVEASARAGYRHVYTSDPTSPMPMAGIDVLGRFIVRRSTTRDQMKRVLSGDQRELRWLRIRQRCSILLRASVGDPAYFLVWDMLQSRNRLLSTSQMDGLQAETR